MAATAGAEVATRPSASARDRQTSSRTAVAWAPEDNIDVREWVRAGHRLGAMTRCSQWWLGDWIRYGAGRWGERYKDAARITGYDIQSLRNFAYVAGRVEPYRRRDNLTWSHHAELCALEPEEQDRWLDVAENQSLSVKDMRVELRTQRRGEAGKESGLVKLVKCPECEHEFPVGKEGSAAPV